MRTGYGAASSDSTGDIRIRLLHYNPVETLAMHQTTSHETNLQHGAKFKEFDAFVNKHKTRNFWLHTFDGIFFFFGMSFMAFETVMPVFVLKLGGSNFIISLIPFLFVLSNGISPILISYFIEQLDRKKPAVMVAGFLMRIPWLLIAVLTYAIAKNHPRLLLALLIFSAAIFAVGSGLVVSPWFDLVAKTTTLNIRGRMQSIRSGGGNLLGIAAGFMVSFVLANVGYPSNYALLFGMGFSLLFVSLVMLSLVKEPVYPIKKPQSSPWQSLRSAPGILRSNTNFFYFVIIRSILMFFFTSAALFSAYAMQEFNLSESHAGIFTNVRTATFIAIAPLLGWLADKRGHRFNLIIASLCAVGASVFALMSANIWLYYPAFVCVCIILVTQLISGLNAIVEFCSSEERPTYIGLCNMLMLPSAILAPIMGIITDAFGYHYLFIFQCFLGLTALALSIFKLKDPRTIPAGAGQ
ncbi:MAG: MFS transporter [Chitinivibrionales bacterium]|nr:MFS transporter [Chitinivibrionales bacterium]